MCVCVCIIAEVAAPDSRGLSPFEDYNVTTPVGVCAICGDSMLKAVPAKLLTSENILEPMSREVALVNTIQILLLFGNYLCMHYVCINILS